MKVKNQIKHKIKRDKKMKYYAYSILTCEMENGEDEKMIECRMQTENDLEFFENAGPLVVKLILRHVGTFFGDGLRMNFEHNFESSWFPPFYFRFLISYIRSEIGKIIV